MIASYLEAKLSGRGATWDQVQARKRSCFGSVVDGIQPCPLLRGRPGKRYCGGCGCGPRPEAILDPDPITGQSKLQFTRLRCPLKRPGFTNEEETDA